MTSIWALEFWQAAAERSISTAAQAGLAYIPVTAFTVIGFDWAAMGGLMAGGAVASLLKSLVVNAWTGTGPSVVKSEVVPRRALYDR